MKQDEVIEHSEFIKEFYYDYETGVFTRIKSGHIVGSKNNNGYIHTKYKGKCFYLHRLAWFYVYKEMPNGFVDHINGIKSDNRIKNLRVVSREQNYQNAKAHKDNKSGLKGAHWNEANKNWRSSICIYGKKIELGSFDSPEKAHEAYVIASKKYQTHGVFGNV